MAGVIISKALCALFGAPIKIKKWRIKDFKILENPSPCYHFGMIITR